MNKPVLSRGSLIAGSPAFPVVATFPDAITQDDVVDPAPLKPGEATADRKLIAFVNGKERFEAAIRLQEPDKPVGTRAFVLTGPDSDPRHLKWMAMGLPTGTDAASALLALATLKRIDLDRKTAERGLALMHPGSTMMVTDQPAHAGSRSDPGFTIITHDT